VIYLTFIGLSLAFASVTFTYSNNVEDKKALVSIGENFLYAAVSMIVALLISWLSFQANNFLKKFSIYTYLRYVLIFLFFWGQTFLMLAAFSLHNALAGLENHLFFRVKEKIK
jgi:hypothetical protein